MRLIIRSIFFVVGVSSLFWAYTFIVGLIILSLLFLSMVAPRVINYGSRMTYRTNKLLREPITYGITQDELSIKAKGVDLRVSWERLSVWRENQNWLILSPLGIQPLYFKIDELKQANIYDSVLNLATKHGKKYGSQSALAV